MITLTFSIRFELTLIEYIWPSYHFVSFILGIIKKTRTRTVPWMVPGWHMMYRISTRLHKKVTIHLFTKHWTNAKKKITNCPFIMNLQQIFSPAAILFQIFQTIYSVTNCARQEQLPSFEKYFIALPHLLWKLLFSVVKNVFAQAFLWESENSWLSSCRYDNIQFQNSLLFHYFICSASQITLPKSTASRKWNNLNGLMKAVSSFLFYYVMASNKW